MVNISLRPGRIVEVEGGQQERKGNRSRVLSVDILGFHVSEIFSVSTIVEAGRESSWRLSARYSQVDLVSPESASFLNSLATKPDVD
jgi:hypothetical protein